MKYPKAINSGKERAQFIYGRLSGMDFMWTGG